MQMDTMMLEIQRLCSNHKKFKILGQTGKGRQLMEILLLHKNVKISCTNPLLMLFNDIFSLLCSRFVRLASLSG